MPQGDWNIQNFSWNLTRRHRRPLPWRRNKQRFWIYTLKYLLIYILIGNICLYIFICSKLMVILYVTWMCCVLVTQSCLTLCDPMYCSPPGSSVPGILQARIQEWVAISFSRGSSQLRDSTCISYISCIGRRLLYP